MARRDFLAPGAAGPASPPSSETLDLLGPLLAFLVVVILYARTLGYPLVWDDSLLVRGSAGLAGLWRALSASFWGVYGRAAAQADFYRPAASVSLWLDGVFWNGRAFGFHLTNLLLAAVGAALLVALLRRRGLGLVPAALGGVLFAAHPLHAESVPFVSDRTDLLALDFFLGFLLAWPAPAEPWRPKRAAVALALLLLSLLSKEMALLAPLALAWEVWLARSGRARTPVPARGAKKGAGKGVAPAPPAPATHGYGRLAWLLLPLAIFVVLRAAVLGVRVGLPGAESPAAPGWGGVGPTLLLYGRLLLWPFGACAEYAYPPHLDPRQAALGIAGWALLAFFALWRRAPRPVRWAAGLAALFALPGALPGLAAARFLYFASAFACAALAAAAQPAAGPAARPRVWVAAALGLLALPLAAGAWARTQVWRSNRALFRDCTECSPRSPRSWANLGVALEMEDQLDEAEAALRHALALQPQYDRALSNLASVLRRKGQLQEAEAAGRRAVELEPADADAHFNLATVLESARPAEAAAEYRAGLAVREEPRARLRLAQLLSDAGDHAGALEAYRAYLADEPSDASDTHGSMAWELLQLGRLPEAEQEGRAAIAAPSASPASYTNLGLVLLARGREAEALDVYRRALDLEPSGAVWGSAAGDVVGLIRAGGAPPGAHLALGLIAGRAGLAQAQAREAQRYLTAAPGGPLAALARGWAAHADPARAARERQPAGTAGSPRESLRALLWGK
ncbi:MAG TPA: tetratricopeptide repeat protein [Candidatus Saccharimonadales bacterium]|nr:tetratricopeptide repeat protein [Candidatus Saccharimonadales bacterium]